MNFALPKSQILRGRGSFSRVFSKGRFIASGPVRCSYLFDPTRDRMLRIGVAISRSVRNAAVRNYLKRRMREEFRAHRHVLFEGRASAPGLLEIVLVYAHSCHKRLTRTERQNLTDAIVKCLSIVGEQCRSR